ncbi:MAG: DUF5615 family PIN-like protein [Thermoleophilaceae bacterium]|nr:DUF5615 family PIN-like protein [Thermoleophilaceae bacterium]
MRLLARDIDTVAIQPEPGLRKSPDAEVFALAQSEGRVTVTYNIRDFMPLHSQYMAESKSHHGLILLTESRFPQRAAGTFGHIIEGIAGFAKTQQGQSFTHWLQ